MPGKLFTRSHIASKNSVVSAMRSSVITTLLFVILLGVIFDKGESASCYSYTTVSSVFYTTYSTPNYPFNTYGLDTCMRYQASISHYRIKAHVTASRAYSSSSCSSYYFELRDGSFSTSRLLRKWCGTTLPSDVVSSQRYMYLRIKTPFLYGSYLRITFIAVPSSSSSTSCTSMTAYPYSRTISSSGWPLYYPSNHDQCWKISASSSQNRITISAISMDLESDCSDFVEIRNGYYSYSTLLRKWCGSSIPSNETSSGRYLYIRFKTDGTIQKNGFLLGFKEVEGAAVTVSVGTIVGPVVGSVIVIATVVIILVCCSKSATSRGRVNTTVTSIPHGTATTNSIVFNTSARPNQGEGQPPATTYVQSSSAYGQASPAFYGQAPPMYPPLPM